MATKNPKATATAAPAAEQDPKTAFIRGRGTRKLPPHLAAAHERLQAICPLSARNVVFREEGDEDNPTEAGELNP